MLSSSPAPNPVISLLKHRNALLFSPSFDGHRQVYVFVLTSLLREHQYNVFIAGNFQGNYLNTHYLELATSMSGVTKIDTSCYPGEGQHIHPEDFSKIIDKHSIDLTIFTEADNQLALIVSQLPFFGKKFRSKRVGIFIRTFHIYEPLSLRNKYRYAKYIFGKRGLWRSDNRVFHEIIHGRFRLLDETLSIDELFTQTHPYARWIPDVFQDLADTISPSVQAQQVEWTRKINAFKETHQGKFVVLYFGTSQARRGYETLLRIAVELGACFVHCGLTDPEDLLNKACQKYRKLLTTRGMLFETNEYISDPDCIEAFFRSTTHLILPYRNFLGSSGVMLQALRFGIPVLVPDTGIMAYRVKKHHLGMTYPAGDPDIVPSVKRFISIPSGNFNSSIREYMKVQSAHQLRTVLEAIIKAE